MDSYKPPVTKQLFKSAQIVWFVLMLVEALLVFRFVLKILGVNPEAKFTSFVYALSLIFSAPFLLVLPTTIIQNSVFEWTILLAMLVYWMIAFVAIRLLTRD